MELDDSVEELEPLSFCWDDCWISFVHGWKRERLRYATVHIRFELEPSFEKDVQALKVNLGPKTAPKEYTKV